MSGTATARSGKPYIWATWLTGLLGGKQCQWAVWFKAHFNYHKFTEEEAFDLAEWNRDHNRMMRDRRAELEEAGWTVAAESQNQFKLEGQVAVVSGKPDLVATMPGHVLVVDGKTGRERDSDFWQVLLYLYALPKSRPDLATRKWEGEIQYKRGDKRVTVPPSALTPQRMNDIVAMIKTVGGAMPPTKSPSRDECKRCNIGFADCPERYRDAVTQAAMAAEF